MHETILQTLTHTVQHIGEFVIDVHDSVRACVYVLGTILGSSDILAINLLLDHGKEEIHEIHEHTAVSIGWPTAFWINMCDVFNCFSSYFCRQHVRLSLLAYADTSKKDCCCYELTLYCFTPFFLFSTFSLVFYRLFFSLWHNITDKKATKNGYVISWARWCYSLLFIVCIGMMPV